MKKVLISIYNLQGGGAEKVLINLLDSFDYESYDVTLFVLRKEGIYLNKIPNKIKIIYGFKTLFGRKISNKVFNFFRPSVLYKMFIKEHFDIEISFLEGYATKIISGSFNKSKKIAWVHADFNTYHWTESIFSYKEELSYYEAYDNIVCVSNECRKSFNKMYNLCDKTLTIYNLLDKNLENYPKINFNNVFKSDKKIKLLYVGRLEKEKGVDRLICAYKDILDMGYTNTSLSILGDGSLFNALKEYISNNSMDEYVNLISFKENVYDYILSSDFIIVPSYSESYSMVLAEGISLNRICIATDTVGAREVLDNGEYGLIVDNSKEGIVKGIIDILSDDNLRRKYIENMKDGNYIFRREIILGRIFKLLD